jgi:hypothetical protein
MAVVRVLDAQYAYQSDSTTITADVALEIVDDQSAHMGTLTVSVQAQNAQDGLVQAMTQAQAIGKLLAAASPGA